LAGNIIVHFLSSFNLLPVYPERPVTMKSGKNAALLTTRELLFHLHRQIKRMQARLVIEDLAVDHDFIGLGFPQNGLQPVADFRFIPTSDMLSACCTPYCSEADHS
jgi:hypothetical protein